MGVAVLLCSVHAQLKAAAVSLWLSGREAPAKERLWHLPKATSFAVCAHDEKTS